MRPPLIRIRFFTGNSILGTGWGHSFAADDAQPSHHFAQESPQPRNLMNLVANAYQASDCDPPSGSGQPQETSRHERCLYYDKGRLLCG